MTCIFTLVQETPVSSHSETQQEQEILDEDLPEAANKFLVTLLRDNSRRT